MSFNVNMDFLIKYIDRNNNGIIDANEVQKAVSMGLNAQEGQPVNTLLTQNSQKDLQKALEEIDNCQINKNINNDNLFEASAMMNKTQQTNGINNDERVNEANGTDANNGIRKRLSFYA